jgi:hypothetical protein
VLEVQVVEKNQNTVSALLHFEHPSSAVILAESNGMPLGDSVIKVRQVAEPAPPQRLYNQDRLLHLRPPSLSRSDSATLSDPFAFSINHIRPHQVSASPLKANVQPFVPNTYSESFSPNTFSFQRDFATPVPRAISLRRGSADERSAHKEQASSAQDEHLAMSVEQLLIGDSLQGEVSESEQSSGSRNHSQGKNASSDESNSRTPPSSPHQPEGESGSSSGNESDRKPDSIDGKSDTVVGQSAGVNGKGDRWSAGNSSAQWISTAWCELRRL